MRIERLQQNHEIKLKYTLFPLHPNTPDEGLDLTELFRGRDIDIAAAQQHLQNLATEEGLDFSERKMTYNSRLAQELAKWAEQQPGGEKIHDLFYRAYFVDGINLADRRELTRVVESIGLDGSRAGEVLEDREFREAVDKDWQRCREVGIVAVPTYLCGPKKSGWSPDLRKPGKVGHSRGRHARCAIVEYGNVMFSELEFYPNP